MGGTHSTRESFIKKMNGILGDAFSTTVPATTQRSAGVDEQHGLLFGAAPDYQDMRGLEDFLIKLAEIPSWRTYAPTTLHTTFASTVRMKSSEITEEIDEGFKDIVGHAHTARDEAKRAGVTFDDPRLIRLRLLVSNDTVILAGEPDETAFALREAMLAGLPNDGLLPTAGAWGSGVTLARLVEPLSPADRDTTNTWLSNAVQYLPDSVRLSEILIAVFTVSRTRLQFASGRHALLALDS